MIPVYKGKNYFTSGLAFLKDPVQFTIDQGRELGDFYEIKTPFRKIFAATSPAVIKHVLVTNHRNYIKSPAYKELKLALGNGLITSEGDFWMRQRRLAQPAFYKKTLEDLFNKMVDYVVDACDELETETQFDLSQYMMKLTSDIALRSLFSFEDNADIEKMYDKIGETQAYIMDRTLFPYLRWFYHLNGRHRGFLKAKKDFDEMAYHFIDLHRKSENPPADFITMLLQAEDAETGERMNDVQVRDEAITIFAAGHETSSNALTWTYYLLSQHPEIVEKIRAEVDAVIGDRKPTFSEIMRLTYTKQVIDEGMRLYPPAYAVGREAAVDDEILGEKIPKKSIVFLSIAAAHRNEKIWDNPDDFNPDRFHPDKVKSIPKFAYMPFGAGPRMCIGNHFAYMEMQLLLAMMVRKFDFKYERDQPAKYETLVTLRPKDGMPFSVSNFSVGR